MLLKDRRLQAMKTFAALVLGVALIGVAPARANAQANLIVNGDFENNTAVDCEFNRSNSDFNAKMANATAFGTANEIDIMKGQCGFGSAPQSGTTKIAINTQGAGGDAAFDAFSFQLSQSLVAGVTYTLQLYAQSVITTPDETAAPVEVGLSNSATSFGTLIFKSGVPSTGAWTQFTHTFIAPSNATFLTVRNEQNGAQTKEVWNHIDNFSLIPTPATITTVAMGLNFPFGVAAGSVYIADRNNHVVWKVTEGGRERVAGILGSGDSLPGEAGYNGDGIPATAAQLNSPTGVARDASGNLYIADSDNHIVRKVTPDGIISTVAGTPQTLGLAVNGGLATSATLFHPRGVAVDGDSNINITDSMNQQVRRVDAVTGIITAVAGVAGETGAVDGPVSCLPTATECTPARLNSPLGVAVNASGSAVYIADEGNHKIRKVVVIEGVVTVTTVAGTGAAGFSGDGGLATAANLDSPSGVAVDADGNLYIADTDNHRVRRVSSGGVITTVAGTGVPGSSGDGGPATAAQLSSPVAVAVDGAGDLYIADLLSQTLPDGTVQVGRILKVDFTPPPPPPPPID